MADTIRKSQEFVGDVQEEMKKVTWPDWPQLKNSTFVILIFMLIISVLIFGMDTVIRMVLDSVIGLLGG